MGAAADISTRLQKSPPASEHRVRLEKLRADGLEYKNAERRAGLIAANEVSEQLSTIAKAVSKVIERSKLAPAEKMELNQDLARELTVPKATLAPPKKRKRRKGLI